MIKEENLIENHAPLPYGFRNSYRNLKCENSQDYAQKLYVHEFRFWPARGLFPRD